MTIFNNYTRSVWLGIAFSLFFAHHYVQLFDQSLPLFILIFNIALFDLGLFFASRLKITEEKLKARISLSIVLSAFLVFVHQVAILLGISNQQNTLLTDHMYSHVFYPKGYVMFMCTCFLVYFGVILSILSFCGVFSNLCKRADLSITQEKRITASHPVISYIHSLDVFEENITVLNRKMEEIVEKKVELDIEKRHNLQTFVHRMNESIALYETLSIVSKKEMETNLAEMLGTINDYLQTILDNHEASIKQELQIHHGFITQKKRSEF